MNARGPSRAARHMIEYLPTGPLTKTPAQYSERAIHGSIYRARRMSWRSCTTIPGDDSVRGHWHAGAAIFHMASVIGAEILIWDIADEFGDSNLLVTRYDVGASLAKTLGPRRIVIMRGHGGAVAGISLKEAVFVSVYLQVNSELLLAAHQLGTVKYLTDGEVDLASEILLQPLGIERAWETWAHAAGVSEL